MKRLLAIAACALSVANCYCAELFENGTLRPITLFDPIPANDTIGGYPIFQGDGKWTFSRGKDYTSTRGTKLASIQMAQFEYGVLFATQIVEANTNTGDGASWNGSPCAPGHLVMKDKGRGREDHCLTIDPIAHTVGAGSVTMLSLKLTNTASASRLYNITLLLNPELLGVKGTGVGDWTPESLKAQPYKQAFMEKLTAWAEKLLDASIKALDYSKPQDVFSQIPSFRTLVPIPSVYVGEKYSVSFLSALEDIKHRAGFAAVAFSPQADYKTRNGTAWGFANQLDADKKALENCESGRTAGTPPCKLVKFEELGIAPLPAAKPTTSVVVESPVPVAQKL